jgi:prephenate dehydrogenase
VATDVLDRRAQARTAGARWGTLAEVAACPWIVPAVPIGRLREILIDVAPRLTPGTTVVEVSSVKMFPSQWLQELLPPGVAAVPTHPLFGPDSAARSMRGLPLVVCPLPGHSNATSRVIEYSRSRGLRVLELSPEEHDSALARSQALTFFLSRVLSRLHLPDPDGPVGTPSYRRLHAALESVVRDSDELYHDLVRFNPHAGRFLAEFTEAVAGERAALGAPV